MTAISHRLASSDVLAGIGIVALSLGFGFGAISYDIGSLARMQAGFFPLVLGVIGTLLGVALIIMGLARQGEIPRPPALRPLLFISAAFIAFSLTIDRLGLIPAIVICGTIAAKATPSTTWREALMLSAGLAVAIWLLFIVLLSMPIRVWAGF